MKSIAPAAIPARRFWTNFLGTRALQLMTGYPLEDSQCGFRMVASAVLRCDDCIAYHVDQCVKAGVTDEELWEALDVALIVGGSIVIPHLRRAVARLQELASAAYDALYEAADSAHARLGQSLRRLDEISRIDPALEDARASFDEALKIAPSSLPIAKAAYDVLARSGKADAGIGYGGSCFPKDVLALAHMAKERGRHPQLIQAVMDINADRRRQTAPLPG